MWDFAKSVLSFSWAMSLFGIQQMASLLVPSKAAKGFQDLTRAAEAELNNPLKSVFRAGDALQKGFVVLTFGPLAGQAFSNERWPARATPVGQQSADPRQSSQTITNATGPRTPPFNPGSLSTNSPRSGEGWGPMPKTTPSPSPDADAPNPSQFPS